MPDPRFESGSQFSESEISEIERVLGRNLPNDYCEFVKEYGGAFVGGLVDGSQDLPILKFFSAGHDGGILDELDKYNDLKKENILPFARDELGNIYVLNGQNSVYYINYYGGKTTSQKVAINFKNFVSRIVVIEE
ncbi:SMI1/KNR4 family protein [Sphingomonas sp. So64.6b]|uniref:SMI1/KNR4 family protein n=1 Tax=Sphingomonas sp. So64.6b TaxID=2997354 RepID=UPI0016026EAA|nr:SMI1/KNR4 family protein [Sphingomonas sp. So64.6b]QNA82919.1 SMI1/KNR4 family protein [Sphingomonas sp. So64.6b]